MKLTKGTISANSYYLFGFKKIETAAQLFKIIGIHALVWVIFFTLPLFFFRIQFSTSNFIYRELINKLFLIGFFYFNYLYLIPRFFFKRKVIYFLLLLLTFLLSASLQNNYAQEFMYVQQAGGIFEGANFNEKAYSIDLDKDGNIFVTGDVVGSSGWNAVFCSTRSKIVIPLRA